MVAYKFQFQSGTIKGKKESKFEIAGIEFQFQSGTIKGSRNMHGTCLNTVFQFQSGTIKGYAALRKGSPVSLISIPIWYD